MEEWVDIEGYEGLYQISNMGRVKSLERKFNTGNNGYRILKEKILKPVKNPTGYLMVTLYKCGKSKSCNIHRLVAQAFIPNPKNLPQVNHIDENKENNCIDNLEWVTCKENINHGTRNKRASQAMKGRKHTKEHNKKVSEALKKRARDMSMGYNAVIASRPPQRKVQKIQCIETGEIVTKKEVCYSGKDYTRLNKHLQGKRQSYRGYHWRYAD